MTVMCITDAATAVLRARTTIAHVVVRRQSMAPITWRSVWQGIMDVWGVGTRSLPYTLWQLLWRPGYLMRDYISGKRQVSFPPVKMLVIVGIFAV